VEDTVSLVSNAVAEATQVADHEPIPGDESPEAVASEEPSSGAEAHAEGEQPPAEQPSKEQPPAQQRRRGPIPFDRHQAVLTKARNEAKTAQEALQKRLDELSGRYESEEIQARLKLMDLLESNPQQAVALLKQVDGERFKSLSWAEQQAAAAAVADAAAAAQPSAGERPEPDALMPDGTLGYSADGALKLVEWRLAQERSEFNKQFETFRKELSPITTEHQARVKFDEAVQRQGKVLESARKTWEGFTEHEAEIRQKLVENPAWDLNDAYRAAVVPKLKGSREAIRAEERKRILDEMNARGKAKGVLPGQPPAAAAPSEGAERTTVDLVREAVTRAAA
jgi:hypothetical protein